jgi:hypothetical protein
MKKNFLTVMTVLLISMLVTSTAAAGGAVRLTGSVGASWPLHLDGTLYGLGGYTQGVTVTLNGFGNVLSVTCTSPGGNQAPGQNPGKISVSGNQDIGAKDISKKGSSSVQVLADNPVFTLQACPNNKWTPTFDIAWDYAIVQVYDKATDALLLWQHYACAPALDNPGHYICTLDQEISYH